MMSRLNDLHSLLPIITLKKSPFIFIRYFVTSILHLFTYNSFSTKFVFLIVKTFIIYSININKITTKVFSKNLAKQKMRHLIGNVLCPSFNIKDY